MTAEPDDSSPFSPRDRERRAARLLKQDRRLFRNRVLAALVTLLLVALFWFALTADPQRRAGIASAFPQSRGAIAIFHPPPPTARGVLVDVQILDIGHARSFTLRSSDGRERNFEVDPSVDMTPGHMREHMAFGEPVSVTYRRDGTRLIATQVAD